MISNLQTYRLVKILFGFLFPAVLEDETGGGGGTPLEMGGGGACYLIGI